MVLNIYRKYRLSLLYGIVLALLLFLLKWLELRFIIFDHAFEIYVGAIALIFTTLGIWIANKLLKPKTETIIVEKEIYIQRAGSFILDEKELNRLGISKRELEVLELMASGLSNQDIAAKLFVSLNTIKTHSSRIFEKLDVQRRTQAVEKARRMMLIP